MLHIVYRASVGTNKAYYGYCIGDSQQDVEKTFWTGANRGDTKRADVRLAQAGDVTIEIVDLCDDEETAWEQRNNLRLQNADSISAPTMWPFNNRQCANKEKYLQRAKQMKQATARAAYQLGMWSYDDIKKLPHEAAADLDQLTPVQFNQKYFC